MAARRQMSSRLTKDHLEKTQWKRRWEGWNSCYAVRGPAAERTDWKTRAAALCNSWWWLSTAVASSTSSLSSSGQLSAVASSFGHNYREADW